MSVAVPYAATTAYGELLRFLGRLDDHRVPYTLTSVRPEAVMVQFALPGERWEVEFLVGGGVEIERFRSDGHVEDESALDALWRRLAADNG